jgi:hypothetical protein
MHNLATSDYEHRAPDQTDNPHSPTQSFKECLDELQSNYDFGTIYWVSSTASRRF